MTCSECGLEYRHGENCPNGITAPLSAKHCEQQRQEGWNAAKEKAMDIVKTYQTSLIAVENKGTGIWESKTIGEYLADRIAAMEPDFTSEGRDKVSEEKL